MHEDFQVHVDSDWVGDLLGRMNTTGMIVRRSIEECVSMTSENKITFETNCETNEYFHLFINTERWDRVFSATSLEMKQINDWLNLE